MHTESTRSWSSRLSTLSEEDSVSIQRILKNPATKGKYDSIPIPMNEGNRLMVLRGLGLIHNPEKGGLYQHLGLGESYKQYVNLISRVFKVPFVAITLIDVEYQWFGSCVGERDENTSDCEKRVQSFCGRTILESAPHVVIVPDLVQDPRFADHPYVTPSTSPCESECDNDSLHSPLSRRQYRYYAAVPLCVEKVKVGTLMMLDTRPRPDLTQKCKSLLPDFGSIVSEMFQRCYDQETETGLAYAKLQLGVFYSLKLPLAGATLAAKSATGASGELVQCVDRYSCQNKSYTAGDASSISVSSRIHPQLDEMAASSFKHKVLPPSALRDEQQEPVDTLSSVSTSHEPIQSSRVQVLTTGEFASDDPSLPLIDSIRHSQASIYKFASNVASLINALESSLTMSRSFVDVLASRRSTSTASTDRSTGRGTDCVYSPQHRRPHAAKKEPMLMEKEKRKKRNRKDEQSSSSSSSLFHPSAYSSSGFCTEARVAVRLHSLYSEFSARDFFRGLFLEYVLSNPYAFLHDTGAAAAAEDGDNSNNTSGGGMRSSCSSGVVGTFPALTASAMINHNNLNTADHQHTSNQSLVLRGAGGKKITWELKDSLLYDKNPGDICLKDGVSIGKPWSQPRRVLHQKYTSYPRILTPVLLSAVYVYASTYNNVRVTFEFQPLVDEERIDKAAAAAEQQKRKQGQELKKVKDIPTRNTADLPQSHEEEKAVAGYILITFRCSALTNVSASHASIDVYDNEVLKDMVTSMPGAFMIHFQLEDGDEDDWKLLQVSSSIVNSVSSKNDENNVDSGKTSWVTQLHIPCARWISQGGDAGAAADADASLAQPQPPSNRVKSGTHPDVESRFADATTIESSVHSGGSAPRSNAVERRHSLLNQLHTQQRTEQCKEPAKQRNSIRSILQTAAAVAGFTFHHVALPMVRSIHHHHHHHTVKHGTFEVRTEAAPDNSMQIE